MKDKASIHAGPEACHLLASASCLPLESPGPGQWPALRSEAAENPYSTVSGR